MTYTHTDGFLRITNDIETRAIEDIYKIGILGGIDIEMAVRAKACIIAALETSDGSPIYDQKRKHYQEELSRILSKSTKISGELASSVKIQRS